MWSSYNEHNSTFWGIFYSVLMLSRDSLASCHYSMR